MQQKTTQALSIAVDKLLDYFKDDANPIVAMQVEMMRGQILSFMELQPVEMLKICRMMSADLAAALKYEDSQQ